METEIELCKVCNNNEVNINLSYRAYWCSKNTLPEHIVLRTGYCSKECMKIDSDSETLECQIIDASCGNCKYFARDKINTFKGNCNMFNKEVIANDMLSIGMKCFVHRKTVTI